MRAHTSSWRMFRLFLAAVLPAAIGCVGQPTPPPETPADTNSGLTGDYVGSAECFLCHADVHQPWQATRHARSFSALQAIGQDKNTACLNCHTTGYGKAGGFASIDTTQTLGSVGCESCHGPARAHRNNPSDKSLRPPTNIASEVCSACHNSFHQQTYQQWASALHSTVTATPANYFTQGTNLNACGPCHSGDFRKLKFIEGQTTVPDTLLQGVPAGQMNAVTCAVCHATHSNTGYAVNAPSGQDWQLRYPQITSAEPINTVSAVQDPTRFNVCGQCHHSRNSVWTDTSRGPHASVQVNFYTGEMPVANGTAPLVGSIRSTHRFVERQCSTCHMDTQGPLVDIGIGDTHYGHAFKEINMAGCSATGCHPSSDSAQASLTALQASTQSGLDALAARMGPASTWEYSSAGGPPDAQQGAIPAQIKKVRYMYHYVLSDGSLGAHNPGYARAILVQADLLLKEIGK